jgi:hypothetical protein
MTNRPLVAKDSSAAVDHLGGSVDYHVGSRLDSVDQIGRHLNGQVVTAHDECDTSAITGQIKHRLTGRVPSAHDHGVQSGQSVGFGDIGPVEDTGTGEGLKRRNAEPPIRRPGGQHHCACLDLPHAGDLGDQLRVPPLEARDLSHEQEPSAEHPSLLVPALAEIRPADPAGEAEVVADQRAAGRLTADGLAFDNQGTHPLGGCENRSGQPSGPSPDHQDVEVTVVSRQSRVDSPRLGNLLFGGVVQHVATKGGHPDQYLRVRRVVADLAECRVRQLGTPFPKGMRDPVPAEQMTDSVPAGRAAVRDHDHLAEVGDVPAGPLLDELGNGAMKELVAFDPRLEHVIVDVADRYGRENRAGGVAMSPSTPLDEQRPAGVGVQSSCPGQQ